MTTESNIRPGDSLTAVSDGQGSDPIVDNLDRVLDVDLELVVKIGDLKMRLKDVLDLHPGSIIEIDQSVDAPLNLLIGSKVLAEGEVVTIGESLGLRIKKKRKQ